MEEENEEEGQEEKDDEEEEEKLKVNTEICNPLNKRDRWDGGGGRRRGREDVGGDGETERGLTVTS